MHKVQEEVIRFSPTGLTDTLDATNVAPGGCASLQNLIVDPTTKDLWMCRPAAVIEAASAPAQIISVDHIIGDLVYGMRASLLYPGHDEPFCYDLDTNSFFVVSGVTAANTPLTQPTTGDQVLPTMTVVGIYLVVTHPGFDGITNFIGWFNLSNPSAPTWQAGNLDPSGAIVLTTRPDWVAQFGQRAYFGVNPTTGQPSTPATDILTLKITNANQALTYGDNAKLTAGHGLPLNNQSGGIIQSLLVFKGTQNIYQVTGDFATNNIAVNTLDVPTGTDSPRSITNTPLGVAFLAPDGVRLVDFNAHVSQPIGEAGTGVTYPFLDSITPTRVCAACNANTYRVSVRPSNVIGTPWQEYWFNLARGVWSGPHTFPATNISAWGNTFIMVPISSPADLFSSASAPYQGFTTVENGVQMQFAFQTSMLPDPGHMAMMKLTQLTVNMACTAAQGTIAITAQDENGSVYNTFFYMPEGTPLIWGQFIWGAPTSIWGSGATGLRPRWAAFSAPVLHRRLAIVVSGMCDSNFKIGDIFIRRFTLGYLQATL